MDVLAFQRKSIDASREIAIGDAAKKLNDLRNNWLNPKGAAEAELKKRTLTNLYNAKPTWLQKECPRRARPRRVERLRLAGGRGSAGG